MPPATSLTTFLRCFGSQGTPRFFFDADEAANIVNHLQREVPSWAAQTIADADTICTRTVRLLGADRLDLAAFVNSHGVESRIPWHWDVLSEYQWDKRTYHKKIAIPYDRADIKVPWELSRCQHLPSVGIAYLVTGNPRYATEIITQIEDWIDANPPGYGVNWACTMDIAIRAVNWLWAYNLIVSSASLGDAFVMKFLASLISHARHITRNIERYAGGITTNHTLANYVGLLYLGLTLPEFPEAERWTADGMNGIEDCMKLQVLPDGADFENSIAYHRCRCWKCFSEVTSLRAQRRRSTLAVISRADA